MDCRTFRKHHLAFVDDTLPAVDTVAMQRHVSECPACACHDTKIRRALLLFRNVPSIQPSADFMDRLNARLRDVGPMDHRSRLSSASRFSSLGGFFTMTVGVLAAGLLITATVGLDERREELALAPVYATAPVEPRAPMTDHAFMASMTTGAPMWSAVLLADQAPVHFARTQFRLVAR